MPVLDGLGMPSEVIVVDDGSRDETCEKIAALCRRDPRIKLVRFSRNFGKEAALRAGQEHASGQAIVQIDADLQRPPELIETFFRHGVKATRLFMARGDLATMKLGCNVNSRRASIGSLPQFPRLN